MNLVVVIVIGAVFGALDGVAIFFAPGFSLAPDSRWWVGMEMGALDGFVLALVIYLAKGGPKSGDAPFVIPSGIIFGALTGLFIIIFAVKGI